MNTGYEVIVTLNNEKYIVTKNSYGYADKDRGRDFSSPWVSLFSNHLTSKITDRKLLSSVFYIGGGCHKVGPVKLPRKLLSCFYYEGKAYEFNFSRFWTFCKTEFDCRETDTQIIWHVEQKTLFNRMVSDISCEKDNTSCQL